MAFLFFLMNVKINGMSTNGLLAKVCKLIIASMMIFIIFACNIIAKTTQPLMDLSVTETPVSDTIQTREPLKPNVFPENGSASYIIQSGDTLPALSLRFKVSQDEIIAKNPEVFANGPYRTLPPGQNVHIDIPQEFLGLTQNLIIADADFVYGPKLKDFDAETFVNETPGWLKVYVDNSSGNAVGGKRILQLTAENYSISPKVLLALVEYHLHGLSDPHIPTSFSLGNTETNRKTIGKQLSWAANALNNGYYGWREGLLTEFVDATGGFVRPHPTSNAGSVAFQYYFSRFLSGSKLEHALGTEGFLATYERLFGPVDFSMSSDSILIPENLDQPALLMPLQHNVKWSFSGGPHSGWGTGYPYAAIDFAPPAEKAGCDASPYNAIAAADGVISRVDDGILSIDLDGDGSARTGWNILYIHLTLDKQLHIGDSIKEGQLLGHPSCLAGSSSGRNVHIARLYNGEWIPAGGVIPFVMDGWTASYGEKEYKGYLNNQEKELRSSSSGEWFSQIIINNE